MAPVRLAILTSHPIQYYAPLFRELAKRVDLHVLFAHRASAEEQGKAGFGISFEWDVDLTSGYSYSFVRNVSQRPGTDHFFGCDTPEIGRDLREREFDAVLILGWHLKVFIQALVAAKRMGLPVMVRGDSQLETPRSAVKTAGKAVVYPPFLRLFDAALYVGRRSRAYYEHYRYPRERLFFSPHCVDTEWFSARATPEARVRLRSSLGISVDAKVLLFAGKLVPFKRPLDLIAAAAKCRAEGRSVEVMVAGAGELEDAMKQAARTLAVPLHLLGFQNQSEMPTAFAASDFLVLPSNGQETWGLVANEALACGRPIVVSDACGCAPDLAADGMAGRVFPMGDLGALARAVDGIIRLTPASAAIAAKSEQFGLNAAADGIEMAVCNCSERRPVTRGERHRVD